MKDINKKIEEMKAKKEANKMFRKMITDMILESDLPENQKATIRVLNKVSDVESVLDDMVVLKYATPGSEANTETLKKVLEYLELVEIGIKQFVEDTPYVANTEE